MSDVKALVSKLNATCKRAMETAAELCLAQTHFSVEIEHFLLRLLDLADTDFQHVLRHHDIDQAAVRAQLTESLERFPRGNARTPALSAHILRLLEQAWVAASIRFGETRIRSGALLVALLEDDGLRALVFEAVPILARLPRGRLIEELPDLVRDGAEGGNPATAPRPAPGMPSSPAARRAGSATPALDAYTIDLTAAAAAGKIDPIIGRDAEIRQIVDILMRRRQNNPILTGEAGVGKTAVVEGLAQQIVDGTVPPALQAVSLRILDLGLLQAGAGIKGEFENRLRQVIDEVTASPSPIVLFIDEAHTLIGAGGAAGQGDAANLLKPALARGELRTIAATTWAEYKRYFEKDPALARRFQVVKVAEPSEPVAIEMLRGLVPRLETHHGVRLLDEAVIEAVRLSHRYIPGRQLPDKAISLLDTAAARVAIAQSAPPAALQATARRSEGLAAEIAILTRESATGRDHAERIERLTEERERIEDQRHRLNARWRQEDDTVRRIRVLEGQLEKAKGPEFARVMGDLDGLRLELEAIQEDDPMVPVAVDRRVVASVVAGWTGIPMAKMLSDNVETVRTLKTRMAERIVGQDAALDAVCRRIRTYYADLGEPGKPTGVFLLVGPSGVGKTETAATLADLLFGGERTMITVNMSEYQEAHSVSGLKGAPPGYVGYGKGGVLTEAVRRNPYSVVLLDEVEKAHPDVMELFYQVFDKGVLEDSEGVPVDFKNTIILLTSNLGSDTMVDLFRQRRGQVDPSALIEAIRPELVRHFKPALLGRLVIVPYMPLGDRQIRDIVRLKLARVQDRFWRTHRAELSYAETVVAAIAARCTETDSGARAIDNILTNTLLPDLSAEILDRLADDEPIDVVHIDLDPQGTLTYDFRAPRGARPDRRDGLS